MTLTIVDAVSYALIVATGAFALRALKLHECPYCTPEWSSCPSIRGCRALGDYCPSGSGPANCSECESRNCNAMQCMFSGMTMRGLLNRTAEQQETLLYKYEYSQFSTRSCADHAIYTVRYIRTALHCCA